MHSGVPPAVRPGARLRRATLRSVMRTLISPNGSFGRARLAGSLRSPAPLGPR